MSTQLIDFTLTGGDTGENDSTAVEPVLPGERVSSSVMGRFTWNLQNRTQTLRNFAEDTLYRLDANMKWAITGGTAAGVGAAIPSITTWNSTSGALAVSADLLIQPLNTPATNKAETKTYTFTDSPYTGTLSFLTTRKAGTATTTTETSANRTVIDWETSADITEPCKAVISGSPPHILTITLRTGDAAVYMSDVVDALDALDLSGELSLTFSHTEDGAIVISALPADAHYEFSKTAERQMFLLPAATLSTFISSNPLTVDGDSILMVFDDVAHQRQFIRGACTVSNLVLAESHPENIPMAIPLVKRIGDNLFWLDGTVSIGNSTSTMYFGESQTTVNRVKGLTDHLVIVEGASGNTRLRHTTSSETVYLDLREGTTSIAKLAGSANQYLQLNSTGALSSSVRETLLYNTSQQYIGLFNTVADSVTSVSRYIALQNADSTASAIQQLVLRRDDGGTSLYYGLYGSFFSQDSNTFLNLRTTEVQLQANGNNYLNINGASEKADLRVDTSTGLSLTASAVQLGFMGSGQSQRFTMTPTRCTMGLSTDAFVILQSDYLDARVVNSGSTRQCRFYMDAPDRYVLICTDVAEVTPKTFLQLGQTGTYTANYQYARLQVDASTYLSLGKSGTASSEGIVLGTNNSVGLDLAHTDTYDVVLSDGTNVLLRMERDADRARLHGMSHAYVEVVGIDATEKTGTVKLVGGADYDAGMGQNTVKAVIAAASRYNLTTVNRGGVGLRVGNHAFWILETGEIYSTAVDSTHMHYNRHTSEIPDWLDN